MNSHHFDIALGSKDESPVAAHFTSESHTETNFFVMIINGLLKKKT